ncbi:MAG TPA: phosphate ABC transporter permease PstA [Thermoplasmata archaeon]|nr:phosphate ABC transporter permease PstA [Thermoplasmata archaeon]
MKFDRFARRKYFSNGMAVLTGLAIVAIMVPLAAVIYETVLLGGSVFNVDLFTKGIPQPCTPLAGVTCQQGGLVVPIEGSILLMGLSALFSVPIGIGAAIFAVEYAGERKSARIVGIVADVLSGVPSIVAGAFIYALIVVYDPTIVFSTLSGSLALAVIMIPIVTRTCEEALRTVPNSVREAALALGISRWKTTLRIVLVSALPGIVTGVLLAVARAAGEAAPLLILLGNGCEHPLQGLSQEGCALPLWIYVGATSSSQNLVNLAWGAALLLLLLILVLSIASRLTLDRLARRMRGE